MVRVDAGRTGIPEGEIPDVIPSQDMTGVAIIAMYELTPREVELLKQYAGHLFPNEELAERINGTQGEVAKLFTSIKKKTGITQKHLLSKLGQWLLHNKRPPANLDLGSQWRCSALPEGCGELKPVEEFPLIPIDLRCQSCIEYDMGVRREKNLAAAARKTVSSFVKSINAQHLELPHLNNMLAEFLEADGGYGHFVREYHKQLDTARKEAQGKKYVLDAHRDFMRLVAAANEQNHQLKDVERMSEEEVQEYMVNLLLSNSRAQSVLKLVDLAEADDDAIGQTAQEELHGDTKAG